MSDRTRAEQLQTILDKGDKAACLKFFEKATETQRREVAKTAIAVLKQSKTLIQRGNTFTQDPRLPVAQIAVLSACSLSELKTLGWQGIPEAKTAFKLLSARRPEWLAEYAESLLEENARHWPLVRALVRRGLCPRPRHENYTLGMIGTLDSWAGDYHHVEPYKPSLIANLRADKELLETEIWELFRIEGQGDLTLAAHDKYLQMRETNTKYCWNLVLKELSKTGELSRDRLLDESLAALNRGFSQFRVAWFSQFHELLEPTVKERLKRQEKYLVLLASPIPPTVTFALDALEIIDGERTLPAAALADALQPVLLARHKGTAKRALQWLQKLAEREAKCKPQAAKAAAGALAHEAAEVQKAAIELLEKHASAADAGLRKQLAQAMSGVAASLRKRLQAWLNSGGAADEPAKKDKARPAASSSLADLEKQAAALPQRWARLAGIGPMLAAAKEGRVEIAGLDFGPLDVPRLDPTARLRVVADIDEWIDVCAHFLESPEEIDEGERVLEGLSRLCDQSPDELSGQLGPLKKRIDKIYRGQCGPFLGRSLRDDVCGIVRAWTSGQVVTANKWKNPHGHMMWRFADKEQPLWGVNADAPALVAPSERSRELAERAAQRLARPLLSAATHQGGWLDPLAFADRLLASHKHGEQPPHYDAALALLRLAPDNRPAALKRIGKLKGELAEAARYALGGEKPAFGKTAALWVAAARARDPRADDALVEKRFSNLGPGAGMAARYEWSYRPVSHKFEGKTYHFVRFRMQVEPNVPKGTAGDLPTVLLNHVPEHDSSSPAAEIRWLGTIWPAGREAWFNRGTRLLGSNLDWSEAEWGNKTYLEPLLDPDLPLGELGCFALCLGLSAKEPGEHTLAADALAAAISDGRACGQRLAPTLAKLLTTANVKPARWAKVFAGVAQISLLHAHIVRLTLENTLAAVGKALAHPPQDVHYLLELLLELLAESDAAVSPPAREALGKLNGGGKAAKAAKAVLATASQSNAARDMAVARGAIQGRIDRARRWIERRK